jgi:hypothetical protein
MLQEPEFATECRPHRTSRQSILAVRRAGD